MKKILAAFCASLFAAHAAFAIETAAKQAIVIDDGTGTVLLAKNADEKMHPSSMSKLMTVYIIFSRLKEGSLKLTDTFPVSERAWRTQGSKMFVELGNRIAAGDLLQGIIIQSGNDACVVMAEGISGSEDAFAALMNDTAKKLGLTNSHFVNATGLPDDNHLMSARDLATLSRHIIHDFPEYYHYFSQKEFEYHGIRQGNRNLLLYKADTNVDGLKTGHTDAGGFGMVASAKDKNGRREIVVVNGLKDEGEREEESERLLAFAFRDFDPITILHKGDVLEKADVWYGVKHKVGLAAEKDEILVLPKTGHDKIKFTLSYMEPVPAPLSQGQHIGDLKIESPDFPAQTIPLVASESVDELHGLHRMWRTLKHTLLGPMNGQFITLEGGEGSGKTTQIRLLHEAFAASGRKCVVTREPGGSMGAETIRQLLLTGAGDKWHPVAETLLFQAARVEHVERVIKPALARGEAVLCDRFLDSTLVYQGIGKGLGIEYIKQMHQLTLGNFIPDLTFVLDIDPVIGLKRTSSRQGNETRFENMDSAFHHDVRNGFLALAHSEPDRFRVINAAQSAQTVHNAILKLLDLQ